LFAASRAVTVKLKEVRVLMAVGVFTVKCVAALLTTLIAFDVPVMEGKAVSVAVMVSTPTVLRVAGEKVPLPFTNVEFGGNVACGSVLVRCTVPV
jgi:hypothetical protein